MKGWVAWVHRRWTRVDANLARVRLRWTHANRQMTSDKALAGAEKSGWDGRHAPQVVRGVFDQDERNPPESQD